MQEIEGLDQEIRRLKEVKALHREYRRYANMPIGPKSKKKPWTGISGRKQDIDGAGVNADKSTNVVIEIPAEDGDDLDLSPSPQKAPKQSLIQQQIRHVYMETMQKIQRQNAGIQQYPNLSKISPEFVQQFQAELEQQAPKSKPDLQNPLEQYQLIAGKSAQTAN